MANHPVTLPRTVANKRKAHKAIVFALIFVVIILIGLFVANQNYVAPTAATMTATSTTQPTATNTPLPAASIPTHSPTPTIVHYEVDDFKPVTHHAGQDHLLIDGICHKFPNDWQIWSAKPVMGRCEDAVSDLATMKDLPSYLAVIPVGSLPSNYYQPANAIPKKLEPGQARVCHTRFADAESARQHRIFIETVPQRYKVGDCYIVKEENAHQVVLYFINKVVTELGDSSYYSAEIIGYTGLWLGPRPLEKLTKE